MSRLRLAVINRVRRRLRRQHSVLFSRRRVMTKVRRGGNPLGAFRGGGGGHGRGVDIDQLVLFAEAVEGGRGPVAAALLADLAATEAVHLAQAAAVARGAAAALQVGVSAAALVPARNSCSQLGRGQECTECRLRQLIILMGTNVSTVTTFL